MTRLIKIDDFFVETDESTALSRGESAKRHTAYEKMGGMTVEKALEAAGDVAQDVQKTIARVCRYVRDSFEEAARPDELSVKFGIKVGGEAGIPYVARGSGEAIMDIQATWKKPTSASDSHG